MNQKEIKYSVFKYLQVLALGAVLLFAPCSVRNTIQDSLQVEKTDVTNKSQATNSFEQACSASASDNLGEHLDPIINTTPAVPYFALATTIPHNQIEWINNAEDALIRQYQSPYAVKDNTPLYLLHQQFKTYL